MIKQNLITNNYLINFLISIIPVSYIAGNLILNLNIILIIITFFFSYKLEILKFDFSSFDKLIIVFFLYIILNGVYNNFLNTFIDQENNLIFNKSISYLRFLFLYLILKFLIKKNFIYYKLIFFSFGLLSVFVSIDLIFQFFFRVDLLGYEVGESTRRIGGPFGDELIAGGFVQRFYIFFLFYFLLFLNFNKRWVLHFYILLCLFLFSLGILFSGNRMPLVLFLLSLLLILIFEKSLRKNLLLVFTIFFLSTAGLINSSEKLKHHFTGFKTRSFEIVNYLHSKILLNEVEDITDIPNPYAKEFEIGILTWKENKIVGTGIKSFYMSCAQTDKPLFKNYKGSICNTHPHNYYLHIANELGIIGLFIIILIFLVIITNGLKYFFSKRHSYEKKLFLPFFVIFLVEIFPLKTTGSFFTTANSTFIFIIISFIVGLVELKNKTNDEK